MLPAISQKRSFHMNRKSMIMIIYFISFLSVLSLLLMPLSTLYQTERTSEICSSEKLPVEWKIVSSPNGEILESKIYFYNNGSLPLHEIGGPSIIVFIGINNQSINNFSYTSDLPETLEAHSGVITYVNISLNYKGNASYFLQVYYYIGNWKPDPYLQDYYYTKFISEVEFSWQA